MVNKNNPKIGTYVFELTNKCNEGCAFCYSVSYDSNARKARVTEQLNENEWISGLENIFNKGAKAVDFSGGEPTLHKNFPEILKKAKEVGLYSIVSTNGTTYGNKEVKTALENYADCIALSMHGIGEMHDYIKGRQNSYTTTIESYNKYISMNKKMKVNTVACKDNLNSLAEIGNAINIENEPQTQWKISQAVLRESGKINRDIVHISNNEFESIKTELATKFQKAYAEGRITFREDDSQVEKHQIVPYVIVSSSGEIHIPIGEQHTKVGANILNKEYYKTLSKFFEGFEKFSKRVNENHAKFYGIIPNSECNSCAKNRSLYAHLYSHGII